MDNFRPSLLPIITSVIGSGLLLFVLNNIAANINLPHIYLQVNSFSSGHNDQQTKFRTIVINDGRSTATDVRLTLLYPSANIINFTIPFHNENITSLKYEKPSALVIQLKRLSMSASIIINTTTMNKHNDITAGASSVNNRFIVSATSDQGTNTISDSSSPTVRIEDAGIIPFNLRLLIFATVLAIICFLIGLLYRRIKNYKFQINRSKFIFDIVKQMISVRDTIKKNILATDIFSYSGWNSIDNESKRQIFSDHRDYNLISKFYTKLMQRDSDFSQEETSDLALKNLNQECLSIVDYALKNINWKKYHTISHNRLHIILSIVATLFSALAIFFIFEVLRLLSFLPYQSLVEPYYGIYYALPLVTRGIVAFFLAREIIIFQSSSVYDISSNNDTISYIYLSSTNHGLIKLLAFSFLIMGVPLFLLGTQLQYTGRSDIAYQFFITILVIDVIRMSILSFIIPRYAFKSILMIRS
jgi:hypothetical protein